TTYPGSSFPRSAWERRRSTLRVVRGGTPREQRVERGASEEPVTTPSVVTRRSGVPAPRQSPSRYRFTNAAVAAAWYSTFGFLRNPWPSSFATRYHTGVPRFFSAFTICSASLAGTRGSFCPWTTNSGLV